MGIRINENKRLTKINKEIKELKKQKRKIILRKGLSGLVLVGTVAAIPTITIIAGIYTGHSPFKKDDVTREAHVKTEFNSDGKKNISKQYESYDEEKSFVYYHSGWTKEDDQYVSEMRTYDVKKLTYDEVSKGIESGNENNVFESPVSIEKLSKDTITEEEKNEKEHYEGIIYTVDKNDTIITPQTSLENGFDFEGFLVIPILLGVIVGGYTFKSTDFFDILDSNEDGFWENVNIQNLKKEKKKLVKKLKQQRGGNYNES